MPEREILQASGGPGKDVEAAKIAVVERQRSWLNRRGARIGRFLGLRVPHMGAS